MIVRRAAVDRRSGIFAALLVVAAIIVVSPLGRLINPNTTEFDGESVTLFVPNEWTASSLTGTPPGGRAQAWSTAPLPAALPGDGALPELDLPDGGVLMHYRYAANEQRGVADVPAGATVENAYLFAPYPLPIFGVDTRIVREAPGACAAVGGDVTLTAELPYLRSTAPESPPETLIGCFAGPDTAAAERRFLQVVETADDGTNERILPTFLSAVGAAVAVWLLGRRREGSGGGGDDA